MLKMICRDEIGADRFKDTDALSVFFSGKTPPIPDRFGYLNQFSPYRFAGWGDTFPSGNVVSSLSDLINNRVIEIENHSKQLNKNIYIMVSGGVDSTALAMAFCHNMTNLDSVHIVFSDASMAEHPNLFIYLKKFELLGLRLIHIKDTDVIPFWLHTSKTDIVVSGFPADQLFGSIINQTHPDLYFKDWRLYFDKKSNDAIQQLEASFVHYNIPIVTFGEFAWYMNFISKWNLVTNIPIIYGFDSNGYTINFFNTPEFSEWSVSNFDNLHSCLQTDTKFYKKELKDYIYQYYKDDYFYANMGKTGSLGPVTTSYEKLGMSIPKVTFMLEDGSLYTLSHSSPVSFDKLQIKRDALMYPELVKYRRA